MVDKVKKKDNWFKKHKVLTVIGVIVLLLIIAGAMGGGDKTKTATTSTPATSTTPAPATVAKIGTAVRDGQFEFIVKGIECGKTVVGTNEFSRKNAQGQYCLLTINVKNIGNAQQYFSESDQKLLNSAGQQYSSDSMATLYSNSDNNVWLAQINPGNSVEGVLAFDIPKDQTPVTAELHDSAFSGGVKVSLQ